MRKIVDTAQPNLMRHIFPTYRVPRVSFAESAIPVAVPAQTVCIEATLSQGVLALQPPGKDQAARMLELLDQLDNQSGLIRAVELRVTGGVGRELLALASERFARHAQRLEPVAVIPCNEEAVASVAGLGLREVGLGVGVSDFQTHVGQSGASRSDLVARLLGVIDACLEQRLHPRLDLLDVTRSDLDSFLFPLVECCLNHMARRGAGELHVRLCDSLGLGLPWNEAPVPRSIPRLLHTIRHAMGLQSRQLEFMGSNDLGLALANSLAAVMAGCGAVACSMAGVGERSGIAPTELVLVHLAGLVGADCDLTVLPQLLSHLEPLGLEPGNHHPLLGEEALTTSELPSDRPMDRVGELYAPFDTGRLLGRPPRVEVRPHSGPSGVAHLLGLHFPAAQLTADDPAVRALHGWIGEHGLREVTWQAIRHKVRELLPQLFEEPEQEDPSP